MFDLTVALVGVSMIKKRQSLQGESFDKALAESLWPTVKTELLYWANTEFTTHAQAEPALLC